MTAIRLRAGVGLYPFVISEEPDFDNLYYGHLPTGMLLRLCTLI